jgi:hypothetical protein
MLMGLALLIPLALYVLSRPRRSSRQAQVMAGLELFGTALIWGGAAYQYSVGRSPILGVIVGTVMAGASVWLLIKNRTHTPS